jgi:hypothetical protein
MAPATSPATPAIKDIVLRRSGRRNSDDQARGRNNSIVRPEHGSSQPPDVSNEMTLRGRAKTAHSASRPRSKPAGENQYDEDDEYDADDTDAAIPVAVTVAAEAATEATKQKYDEKDDEDGSDQGLISFGRTELDIGLFETPNPKPLGIVRMTRYRERQSEIARLLCLDENAGFADVDLDAGGLLALLVEPIAQDHGGDGERADDEVEDVAIRRPEVLCSYCR